MGNKSFLIEVKETNTYMFRVFAESEEAALEMVNNNWQSCSENNLDTLYENDNDISAYESEETTKPNGNPLKIKTF
jgi:hypothetical protein